MLEESYPRMSDYFFILLLIFGSLIITSTIFYVPFLATTLSNTITYIWSRKNPQGIVQIFGFISFSAFFLPFVFPLISLILEGKISKDELVGIAVGQIIFYLRDVYPKIGKDYFKTPCWLHFLFRETCDSCKKVVISPATKRRIADFIKTLPADDEVNVSLTSEDQPGEVVTSQSKILEELLDIGDKMKEVESTVANDQLIQDESIDEVDFDEDFDDDGFDVISNEFDVVSNEYSDQSINIGSNEVIDSDLNEQLGNELENHGFEPGEDNSESGVSLEYSGFNSDNFECVQLEESEDANALTHEIGEAELMPSPAPEASDDGELISDDFESFEIPEETEQLVEQPAAKENESKEFFDEITSDKVTNDSTTNLDAKKPLEDKNDEDSWGSL